MRRTFIIAIFCLVHYITLEAQSAFHAVRLSSSARVLNTIIYKNPDLSAVSSVDVRYTASDSLLSGLGTIRLQSSPFSTFFRIHSNSPVYNRGNRLFLRSSDSLDLDYHARVSCGEVDMGAYEFSVTTTRLLISPKPQHVCEGTAMVLRAEAEGNNLSYQWQRNGQNLVGKVSSNLALSGSLSDTGFYRVIALGDCCHDTSAWVRVDIDAHPSVVAMNDTTVLSESDVTLRVLGSVGRVHWLESNQTTLVLDTVIRNIQQTVQYMAVATNGLCPMEAKDWVTITVSGMPCRVQAKADTVICKGDSYRLLVESATVDYKWYVLGTSTEVPKFSVLRPTSSVEFLVEGIDAQGTACSDTFRLGVRTVALTAMDDRSVCSGSEVELSSVPAADGWYTTTGFFLGTGNYIKVYPPMNATTLYIARRSDGLCTSSDTVRVYANPPYLRVSFNDTVVCEGSRVDLHTNIDPSLVVWKRKSTGEDMGFSPSFLATQTDVYQAWAHDALCGDIFEESVVTVEAKPQFSVVEVASVCESTSILLSSTPHASYWRLLDGTRVNNPVTAVQGETYVGVLVQGVCRAEDTLEIKVDPLPELVLMQDTTIRRGQSVDLWSRPLATHWRELSSSDVLDSLRVAPQDTSYYVASLDAGSCGWLHDTLSVYVIGLDTFFLSIDYDYGCSAGEGWGMVRVLDDGQQNTTYRYLWSNGKTDSLITSLGSGIYTVTVLNSRGVEVKGSFTLGAHTYLDVLVDMEAPVNEQCEGGSIRVSPTGGSPDYQYQWSHGSVSKDLLNIPSGVYHLTVTDSRGCELVKEVRLRCLFRRVMPTLFITPNGDGKNDYLDIKYIENYPNNTVTILNSYGEELAKLRNYDNRNVFWDGRNRKGEKIPDGVYYYIIEADGVENMAGWLLMKLSKSN